MNAPSHTAPTRLALAFLATKERLLAAVKDEGGLFECRFLARLLERERTAVTVAAGEADTVAVNVCEMRQLFLRDIADGQMDDHEQRDFLQRLGSLGTTTRRHATHLQQLI